LIGAPLTNIEAYPSLFTGVPGVPRSIQLVQLVVVLVEVNEVLGLLVFEGVARQNGCSTVISS